MRSARLERVKQQHRTDRQQSEDCDCVHQPAGGFGFLATPRVWKTAGPITGHSAAVAVRTVAAHIAASTDDRIFKPRVRDRQTIQTQAQTTTAMDSFVISPCAWSSTAIRLPTLASTTAGTLRPLGQEGEATKQSSGGISRENAKRVCKLNLHWRMAIAAPCSVIASAAKRSRVFPRRILDASAFAKASADKSLRSQRRCGESVHNTSICGLDAAPLQRVRTGGEMKAPTHLGCASWSRRSCNAGTHRKLEVDCPPAGGIAVSSIVSSRPRLCRP